MIYHWRLVTYNIYYAIIIKILLKKILFYKNYYIVYKIRGNYMEFLEINHKKNALIF